MNRYQQQIAEAFTAHTAGTYLGYGHIIPPNPGISRRY